MASASSRNFRRAIVLNRVGPEGGTDHGPAGGQRPSRPPDVEGGDVAVADGLLPAGVGADALDGQIDFDEALGVGGHGGSGPSLPVNLLAPSAQNQKKPHE